LLSPIQLILIRLCLFTGAVWLLTGCAGTFHEVKPLTISAPPAKRLSTLILGEIKITDNRVTKAEAESFANAIRRGVNDWALTKKVFQTIIIAPPRIRPVMGSLVLTGAVTEVEKGSHAARFWGGRGRGKLA
jgi:hypothetical protein